MSCPPQLAPSGPAVAVVDFKQARGDLYLTALGEGGSGIAQGLTSHGVRSGRLLVRLHDAASVRALMIRSAAPGRAEARVDRAELWSLAPGADPSAILKPTPLRAGVGNWGIKAYGEPGDGDDDLARWLALESLEQPTPVPWWSGSKLLLSPEEDLSRAIAMTGAYEPETAVTLKRLIPRGGVFLDAGANAGAFTIPASRWVGATGTVIAVEPSPRELAKLRANVALNSAANVRVIDKALGARPGRARLLLGDAKCAGLNTLGPALAHGAEPAGEVEVQVTTLDRLCATLKLERLDVVKADIEGGELDLLKGGRASLERFRPALVLEIEASALAAAGRGADEIATLLEGLDYRLFALTGSGGPPEALEDLSGYEHGNVLALPSERVADFERAGAGAAAQSGVAEELLRQLAETAAQLGEEREHASALEQRLEEAEAAQRALDAAEQARQASEQARETAERRAADLEERDHAARRRLDDTEQARRAADQAREAAERRAAELEERDQAARRRLDDAEQVRRNAEQAREAAERRAAELEAHNQSTRARLAEAGSELGAARQSTDALKAALTERQTEIQALEARLAAAAAQQERLQGEQTRAEALQHELERVRGAQAEIERRATEVRDKLYDTQVELISRDRAAVTLEQRKAELDAQLRGLEAERAVLTAETSSQAARLMALSQELSGARAELNGARDAHAARLAELDGEISALRAAAQAGVEQERAKAAEQEAALRTELEGRLAALKAETEASSERQQADAAEQEAALRTELEAATSEQAWLRAELQQAQGDRDRISRRLEAAGVAAQDAIRAERERADAIEQEARDQARKAEQELQRRLSQLRAEMDDARAEAEAAQVETERVRAQATTLNEALAAACANADTLTQDIARQEEDRARANQRFGQMLSVVQDRFNAERARSNAALKQAQQALAEAQSRQKAADAVFDSLETERRGAGRLRRALQEAETGRVAEAQRRSELEEALARSTAEIADADRRRSELEEALAGAAAARAEADRRRRELEEALARSTAERANADRRRVEMEQRVRTLGQEVATAQAKAQERSRDAERAHAEAGRLAAEKAALEQHNQAYQAILQQSRYMRMRKALLGLVRR